MRLFTKKLTILLLWFTIFTMPIEGIFFIDGIGSVNRILSIFLVFVALFSVLINRNIKKLPKPFLILFLFFLWSLMSFYWSLDPDASIFKNIVFIQLFLLMYIMYEFINNKKQLYSIFIAYVFGCTILVAVTVINYLTGTQDIYASRFVIDGYNPNDLGYTLAFSIPFVWFLGVNKSKYYLLLIPLIIFAIVLTGSRTAFLVTGFICFCILWYMFRMKFKYRKIILLCFVLALVFTYYNAPKSTVERLSTISDEVSNGTLNNRTDIWEAGWSAFKSYPFHGVGAGAFGSGTIGMTGLVGAVSAHNAYISVLVEYGLIGFFLFFIFILITSLTLWKVGYKLKESWLCFTIFSSLLIVSLAKHTEIQMYTWFIFGSVWASILLSENKSNYKSK
jgi:O-antigen ligase